MTVEQLLEVLTECTEYAEMPVRHNEDLLNADLAKLCPVKVRKMCNRSFFTLSLT